MNPRPLGYEPNELPLLHPASRSCRSARAARRVPLGSCRSAHAARLMPLGSCRSACAWDVCRHLGVGGVRGGLASRGVAPTVLSGAALGHDRVRDGTGWGQHALGHGHPPPPSGAQKPLFLAASRSVSPRRGATTATGSPLPGPVRSPARPVPHHLGFVCLSLRRGPVRGVSPPSGARRPTVGSRRRWDRLQDLRPRPLGRLGSSRLPAVHLPPINPVICRGSYLG